MNNFKHFDVVIIGAGAAGLMCAAIASKRNRKVLLIDHSAAIGEKIRISGGGRCNFTNLNVGQKNFISNNDNFCLSALSRFTSQDFIDLVKKHNIAFHEKTLGQLFCNNSSKEIIEMLLQECDSENLEISLETEVSKIISCHFKAYNFYLESSEGYQNSGFRVQNSEILRYAQDDRRREEDERRREEDDRRRESYNRKPEDDNKKPQEYNKEENYNSRETIQNKNFQLETNKGNFTCQSLVIATGGLSIPKMGATGFGYEIARQFAIKVTQTYPALVPFTFDENMLSKTKNLAGISVPAIVSCNKINFREAILFTHRGISGPAILQISSYWKSGEKIKINFAPEINIFAKLQQEKKLKPKQEIQTFLAQFLPKNLADFFANQIMHSGNLADLSNNKIQEIADLINNFTFVPSGTEGYAKAEVTLGGVNTDEISSKTFESKKVKGLFFIGEVLDVTGWLGGYNFQWAWASGKAAGEIV